MKKKSCIALAVLLCALQIVSAIAILPVSATATAKSYNIQRTTEIMTIDGKADEEIWSTVQSSEVFVNTNENSINNFTASYKAVWMPSIEDTTKMNVYILITATGYELAANYRNYVRIQIENQNGTHRFWSGMQQLNNINTGSADREATLGTGASAYNVPFKLFAVNDIANSKTATYEFCYTMPKTNVIKLDVLASACTSSYAEAKYSWVSMVNTPTASADLLGVGNIIDDATSNGDVDLLVDGELLASLKKNADGKVTLPNGSVNGAMLGWRDSEGKLYAVGSEYTVTGEEKVSLEAVAANFSVLKGAAVLIENPTALRFDISADLTGVAGVKAFNAIIVQSDLLTEDILSDGLVTKEELDTAEIAYDNVDLTGGLNSELHSAKKENITDFTVKYSAIAYLTVEYADGTEKALTTEYNAADHSRCVKEVAEAAYSDRSNLRESTENAEYTYKVSKDYAVGDFTLFSYSPYEESSLDILAELKK